MTDDEYSQYSAAIHEAGHLVVSHKVGCIVRNIHILYEHSRNRWEGGYNHVLGDPSEAFLFGIDYLYSKGAQVAVAGILSQTKWLFENSHNTFFEYSKTNPFDEWHLFFMTEANKLPDEKVFTASLIDCIHKTEKLTAISRENYSGRDLEAFRKWSKHSNYDSFLEIINHVIETINSKENWQLIKQLATRLVCTDINSEGRKALDEQTILEILDGCKFT